VSGPYVQGELRVCSVCEREAGDGIITRTVPYTDVTAHYGPACREAHAHPLTVLIAETAKMPGGLMGAPPYWRGMVAATVKHLGTSWQTFGHRVDEERARLAEDEHGEGG
jgi:hypothetical protein